MLLLLETVLQRAENNNKLQVEAIVAMANSSQAQAEATQQWFRLFQANMGEGSTHTVRPEDEVADEDKRELDALAAKGYPVHASVEEQMAWLNGVAV